MKEKIEFQIPEGYVIDKEASTDGKLVYKLGEKQLDYSDIVTKLFKKGGYEVRRFGGIIPIDSSSIHHRFTSISIKQLIALGYLNMLCNVAKYLNGGWLPTYKRTSDDFSYILMQDTDGKLVIDYSNGTLTSNVYFRSKELAKQAIEILGEDTIKKALTLNH